MVKFYAYDPNDEAKRIKVMVYKDDQRRCVILSITPVVIEDRGHGLISESIRIGSGVRVGVELMARLSVKRLNQIADEVREQVRAGSGRWFDAFKQAIGESGFTLSPDPFTRPVPVA